MIRDSNVLISVTLAKKLTRLRLKLMPARSRREIFYMRKIRPRLVRLLCDSMPQFGAAHVIVANELAQRIVAFRFKLIPKNSRREIFYLRHVRPVLIRTILKPDPEQEEPNFYDYNTAPRVAEYPNVATLYNPARRAKEVNKILIIKADHIGDFILGLPAIEILKQAFPRAQFTLVCGTWNRELAEATGLFDEIVCVNLFPEVSGQISRAKKFDPLPVIEANLPTFDIAVDLKVEDDTRFLLNYVKARFKAGFHALILPGDLNFVLPVPTMNIYGELNEARHTRNLLAMLASGIVALYESWHKAERLLGTITAAADSTPAIPRRASGPLIGINAGSGTPTRNWPAERFSELIRALIDRHQATILLFGSRLQQVQNAEIMASVANGNVIDLAGKLSLTQLSAMIRDLDLYVGHDTGGTHMAAALGVETLCLHSGAEPLQSFGPLGDKVTVVKVLNLECSPCGLKSVSACRYDHRCMMMITADYVLKEIDRLFAPQGRQETYGLAQRAH